MSVLSACSNFVVLSMSFPPQVREDEVHDLGPKVFLILLTFHKSSSGCTFSLTGHLKCLTKALLSLAGCSLYGAGLCWTIWPIVQGLKGEYWAKKAQGRASLKTQKTG